MSFKIKYGYKKNVDYEFLIELDSKQNENIRKSWSINMKITFSFFCVM